MKSILAVILAGLALLTFFVFFNQKSEQTALVSTAPTPAPTSAPVQPAQTEAGSTEVSAFTKLVRRVRLAALKAYLEFTEFSFQPHITVGKHELTEPRPDMFVLDANFNDQGQALYFAVGKASSDSKFINYISSLHGLSHESFRQLEAPKPKKFERASLSIFDGGNRHILAFWGLEKGVYKLAAQIQLTPFSEAEIAAFKAALGLQGK